MSFKRDKDEYCSLRILQKRRVSDLLSEDIKNEDITLASNGLIYCLICEHKPFFNTLDVFAVHRQGAKHKHYCKVKKEKEISLEELKDTQRLQNKSITEKNDSHACPKIFRNVKPYDRRACSMSKQRRTRRLANTPETNTNAGCKSRQDDPLSPVANCSAALPTSSGRTQPPPDEQVPVKRNPKLLQYGPIRNQEKVDISKAYLFQRCGGWYKDLDGNWQKDADAEFDSDEEPPTL